MTRVPGHKWRRGKGHNRRNKEKAERSNNDASTFQKDDQVNADAANGSFTAISGFKRSGHAHGKDLHARKSDQRWEHRHSGGVKSDGSSDALNGAPQNLNSQPSDDSAGQGKHVSNDNASPSQNKGKKSPQSKSRRNNASRHSRGELNALRNLRAPVKPAPVAAYTPKEPTLSPQKNVSESSTQRPKFQKGYPFKGRDQVPYAALDLGTNNCRLLVALPQERGRFRVIDGFSRIVRLGEGLAHSGRLSQDAMDRAVEALKVCSEKLISHGIKRHRLIATEACRQADNGQVFLDRVRNETGMALEIIDRETEAYLAAEGCGALMDKKADAAVLFDIGGGSSELILVNKRIKKKRLADQIVAWTSLPIGVVTLAERHGGQVVTKETFRNMIDEVKGYLSKFEGRDDLARIWKNGRVHLLGTSGTVTTLAGIHLNLPRYERRLVDGLWMNAGQIDSVVQDLLAMDYKGRASSPCIGSERADLVMAGCAILEAIRQTWPSDRLRVADRGLREGILTQMMDRDSAWLAPKEGRRRRHWPPRARSQNASGGSDNSKNNGNRK